jgi:hypothetical protein
VVACELTSAAATPLFLGWLWFAGAAGAVITAAGAGTLTRLRGPRVPPVPTCLAAGVAALLLYLNLVFEGRHSLLYVIPTPGSLARLRSAALAGLPLLVLFGVPVLMVIPQNQLVNGLVFCLGGTGYLAMLAVGSRASGSITVLAAVGGRASIAVALCALLLLSGAHLSTLFSSGADTGGLPIEEADHLGRYAGRRPGREGVLPRRRHHAGGSRPVPDCPGWPSSGCPGSRMA